MKQFLLSLGVVGPALIICFQLFFYTAVFSLIYIWRSRKTGNQEAKKPDEVLSEEVIIQLTRGRVPWNAVTVLEMMESVPVSLGLLGTGTGLLKVFSRLEVGNAAQSINACLRGYGQAITTTIAGLIISVSALVAVTMVRKSFLNLARGMIKNEAVVLDAVH